MNKKQKQQAYMLMGALLILSMSGALMYTTGIVTFENGGIHFQLPSWTGGTVNPPTNNTQPPGGTTPPANPPTTPTGPPYITLTITPENTYRGDAVTGTIESNIPSVMSHLTVTHIYDGYFTVTADFPLDANGDYTSPIIADYAGWWTAQAEASSVTSNTVALTVKGITIYQTKNTWSVGEQYTGALTGTYRDWYVAIMYKNHTATEWMPYDVAVTDSDGIISYGTYLSDPILPAQVGLELDVIALIDGSDPNGYDNLGPFLEETQFMPTQADIDQAVADGDLVKSNINTFTTVP